MNKENSNTRYAWRVLKPHTNACYLAPGGGLLIIYYCISQFAI